MNHVKSESNHGRRALLAGSAALLAGGAALAGIGVMPAAADADEELVELCAGGVALCRRINDFYADGATPIADDAEREAVIDPLYDRTVPLFGEIAKMEATTLAGHRARARLIVSCLGDYDSFEDEISGFGPEGVILAALVRDLVREDAI